MPEHAFLPLPEATLSAPNGPTIEFAIQRFIVRDVQLRPRVEKHEEKRYHSQTVRVDGRSVGSVGYTTTDTQVSIHNDTRLLVADAVNGQENILDLQGVEDGYFRGDALVLAAWRFSKEAAYTHGYLKNHTRGSSYIWLLDRRRVAAISGRGVLPQLPALIELAIFLFGIWPITSRALQNVAQLFSANSNIPWVSWAAGLLVAWYGTKKTLRWLDKWWHAPIDAAIQTIYRTVENAATRPPLPKEDAEKLRDVTPHEQFTGDEAFDEFRQKLKKRLGLDP